MPRRRERRRGWPASEAERDLAEWALASLDAAELRVVLLPAPRPQFRGHMVRAVERRNPAWYREFYAALPAHASQVRKRVRRALERVAFEGYVRPNGYEVRLLPLLEEHAQREARGEYLAGTRRRW